MISLITLNVGHLCAGEKERSNKYEKTGFFLMATLAEGYKEEENEFHAEIIEPINPSDRFTEGIPEIYSVFHFRQIMGSLEIWARVLAEDAEGLSLDKEIGWNGVYIEMEVNSAFLKLPAPPHGWSKGKYLVEFFVNGKTRMHLEKDIRLTITTKDKTISNLIIK